MRTKWETSVEKIELDYTDRGLVLNLAVDQEPEVSENGWMALNVQAILPELMAVLLQLHGDD